MKSTLYTRITAVALAAFLVACSAASPDAKKAELEKLKKQQADIAKQIASLEKEIAKQSPDSASVKVRSKEVGVEETALRKFDHFVQTQGKVDAEQNVTIGAKTPGVITQVFVKEGQEVAKGQVLAQLDNAVILRTIEAQKAQLELATSVFERQQNLWNQKIGTEVQYLQAKTNKEGLEKQIASLQEQNDMTRIKSPINGTVDQVIAKVGENAAPGAPGFRIVNTSELKLVANISEAYVTNIKQGNIVHVTFDDVNEAFDAKVTFVGRTIDPLSRTFTVEVKLPSKADLRPNMTGALRVVYRTDAAAIVVPVNVIQTVNNEKVLYVAETTGKTIVAKRKVVTVEGVFDNKAEVKGLEPGSKVITIGYQGLNEGDVVKL